MKLTGDEGEVDNIGDCGNKKGCDKGVRTVQCLQLRLIIETVSPPSVTSNGSICAFSVDKTSTNFLKLAKLRRVRNSSSFSLRSRGCMMLIRWSLCGHVMQPTAGLASSVIKASLESIRSSRARRLTARVRIRASSRGQMSPNSGEISTSPIT